MPLDPLSIVKESADQHEGRISRLEASNTQVSVVLAAQGVQLTGLTTSLGKVEASVDRNTNEINANFKEFSKPIAEKLERVADSIAENGRRIVELEGVNVRRDKRNEGRSDVVKKWLIGVVTLFTGAGVSQVVYWIAHR